MLRQVLAAPALALVAAHASFACEPAASQIPPYAIIDVVAIETRSEPFGPERRSLLEWAQLAEDRKDPSNQFVAVTRFRVVEYLYGSGPDVIDINHLNPDADMGMCGWLAPHFQRGQRYVLTLNHRSDGPYIPSVFDVLEGETRRQVLEAASEGLTNDAWAFLVLGVGPAPEWLHDTVRAELEQVER